MKLRGRLALVPLVIITVAIIGYVKLKKVDLAPTPFSAAFYVRWDKHPTLAAAAERLQTEGVLAHPQSFLFYAKLVRKNESPREGTYRFHGGMTADEVLATLRQPIVQKVRLPEGWWIARTAKRLEEKDVCKASEYIALAAQPEKFGDAVKFKLPANSLEGYLYPDTYDLPPLLGAEAVIRRQLHAFQLKIADKLPDENLPELLTEASLIELEVASDKERPLVASVIQNRINKKMALEIDATVLYALQKWKSLGPGVVRTVKSPYNTYLHKGLPPGPIGSPTWVSVNAAAHPATTTFLFYVARPTRTHYFTSSYPDHQAAIKKAKLEWLAARAKKP